jgi:hypothetical protein
VLRILNQIKRNVFYKNINFIVGDDERGLVAVSVTPQ